MLSELGRKALAELVGTAGLVAVVIGSGIAAQRLSPDDVGLQLLENSTATAFGLAALILAFASVSGSHFNPVVTGVDWARGRMPGRTALAFVAAQVAGGALGALLANAMFERAVFETSAHVRTGANLWLGEVTATVGLLAVVHGTTASNARATPFAVAAYIGAAYWFTSSTSFANPAVTVARAFSDSFAGIAPASVPAFVVAQCLGAAVAVLLLAALLPGWWRGVPAPGGESMTNDRLVDKPQILFVCVHNAGRSQMAAAFARRMGQGRVEVLSAGSAPANSIHPNVHEAMKEVGIDLGEELPKLLSDDFVRGSDVVVTMGCGDACPVFPGKRYEDWKLDDPAGQGLPKVREVRDAIRDRVRRLLEDLKATGSGTGGPPPQGTKT